MNDDVMVPEPLPSGYRLQGQYVIESELRRSASMRVYKATDNAIGEQVAIIVPSRHRQTPVGHAEFLASFKAARGRDRRVYAYGEWMGIHFAVVAYVEGLGPAVEV